MKIERAAEDVFDILRSYNYEMTLYDEDGQQVFEPVDASRFFDKKQNLQVALVDDGDDSAIKLYFRKDIPVEQIQGLMQTLRTTATKYNMIFSCREQNGEISPKDFATKVSVAETRSSMNITEGMYGTSRSSYLRLENARMIVRHSAKINENLMGARGRDIDSIYIENGRGERMLFPTVQLAPARALVHHVSNGGCWTDEGGENICRHAKDYSDLRTLARHIYLNANSLDEGAQGVRGTVREAICKMRKTFESICRKTRYEDALHSLKTPLTECDLTEAVANLKSMCTVEGRDLEDRVYETCARCIKEVEDAAASDRLITIAGVPVNRDVWARFKQGDLDLSGTPDGHFETEGYRAYNSAALNAIAAVCTDSDMADLMKKVAKDFATSEELGRGLKAFASRALEIVGWWMPKSVAPTKAVRELADWMDDLGTKKKMPVEDDLDEHCGECSSDVVEAEGSSLVDEHVTELVKELKNDGIDVPLKGNTLIVPNKMCNPLRAWLRDHDFSAHRFEGTVRYSCYTPTASVTVIDRADGLNANEFEISVKAYSGEPIRDDEIDEDIELAGEEPKLQIDLGDDDDAELSLADIILPTDQHDDLSREVSVATVTDPDTGEESLPDTNYISRLRVLSGMGNNLNQSMY